MKKLLIFLIFVTAAIYAQDKGVINGRVTDKETQNPVPEATVNILNTDFKTKTNEKGEFSFTGIPYGTYELKVSSLGYEAFIHTDVGKCSPPGLLMLKLNFL